MTSAVHQEWDGLSRQFAEVAEQVSVDSSRLRGGLIGSISPADPSYPAALRTALERATLGEPTSVVALEQGYAILLVEGRIVFVAPRAAPGRP